MSLYWHSCSIHNYLLRAFHVLGKASDTIWNVKKCDTLTASKEFFFGWENIYLHVKEARPLNLNIQHEALALLAVTACRNGWVLEPSRAVEPRSQRWNTPEPAAANSSKRWKEGGSQPLTPISEMQGECKMLWAPLPQWRLAKLGCT